MTVQAPLFRHFNVDAKTFWDEVNGLPDLYRRNGAARVSKDTVYLNHILSYVRAGTFKGPNNARLKELGRQIEFYEGLPTFFAEVRQRVAADTTFRQHEVKVERYIVSTGLRPSAQWLGNYSPKPQIRESGLWLVQRLKAAPLSPAQQGLVTAAIEKTIPAVATPLDAG